MSKFIRVILIIIGAGIIGMLNRFYWGTLLEIESEVFINFSSMVLGGIIAWFWGDKIFDPLFKK